MYNVLLAISVHTPQKTEPSTNLECCPDFLTRNKSRLRTEASVSPSLTRGGREILALTFGKVALTGEGLHDNTSRLP